MVANDGRAEDRRYERQSGKKMSGEVPVQKLETQENNARDGARASTRTQKGERNFVEKKEHE